MKSNQTPPQGNPSDKQETEVASDDAACCASDFEGWPFVVTIDRNRMERRYTLQTVEALGVMAARNDPMTSEKFREHYGFSEEFPHKFVQRNT